VSDVGEPRLRSLDAKYGARFYARCDFLAESVIVWSAGLFPCVLGFPFHRLAEAIAFTIHFKDLAMVCQSIQQRRCHAFTLKHFLPFTERKVRRKQQARAFVAIREDLEQ